MSVARMMKINNSIKNGLKMSKERIISKCCCIFPVRPSLVVFAVLKIIGDIYGTGFFGYIRMIFQFLTNNDDHESFMYSLRITFLLILDMSFMVLLIISVSKKSSCLLKISYYYSIASLLTAGVSSVVSLTLVYKKITKQFHQYPFRFSSETWIKEELITHAAIIISYILLHIYMILLMKWEISRMSMVGNYDLSDDQKSTRINTKRHIECPYGHYQPVQITVDDNNQVTNEFKSDRKSTYETNGTANSFLTP